MSVSSKDNKEQPQKTSIASLVLKKIKESVIVRWVKSREIFFEANSQYFIFGFLLVLIFILMVFVPRIRAHYYRGKLNSENTAEAMYAERILIDSGGESVVDEMIDEVTYGKDISRIRAMRVLGEIGCVRALPLLKGILKDSEESKEIKASAQEAIIQIVEY